MVTGSTGLRFRSPAEARFYDAWVAMHPSIPLTPQVRILGMPRRTVVDFAVGAAPLRIVVEVDGAAWHGDPESRAADRARDAALAELGWTVVRLAARDVFRDVRGCVVKVEETVTAAQGRLTQR